MTNQEDILSTIPSLLQAHHNSMLKAIPSSDENFQALNSLSGDKAPGPNDFLAFFFQVYWEVVKGDDVKVVQELFRARNLLKELNATFLVLIPMILGVDSMDKFRPISLYNFFHKIISKVLTTKLLSVLHLIISPQ